MMKKGIRILLSYHRHDIEWRDFFVERLKPFQEKGQLYIFDDEVTEASQAFAANQKDLPSFDVIILFISTKYISLNNLVGKEIPEKILPLQEHGTHIIPVYVEDCSWQSISWLSKMKLRPSPQLPFSNMSENEKERHIYKIIEDELKKLEEVKHAKYGEGKYGEGVYGGKNDIQKIYEEAAKAFANSELKRAIELCEKALSINPNHMKAMDLRGTLYRRSGRYDEAIEQFEAILQKDPNNVNALQGKGLALLDKKDYKAAYDTFELLTKLEPDNNIAWHSMGESLFYRDRFDEAIKCFDKSIKINLHNDSSWVMKAKALSKKGEHDSAINCLDQALGYAANKSYVLLEKGIVYGEMGKKNEELYCYNQAIENNPKYIQAYMQKAHVLSQDGDYKAAIECFRKGIDNELKPEHAAILWHNLATTYLEIHNYDEAYRSINRSLELHDNEHTRLVRDAIEKEMSSREQIDMPNVPDEDETKREELVNAFNYFLQYKKGFPENVISRDRIIDVDMPRPDIALIDPESSKVLALVEFSTRSQSLDRLNKIAQEYFSAIPSPNNIKFYIVELAEINSPEQFKIFLLSNEDGVKPISMADFPTYNQLLFESPLSNPGRRIYWALTQLAKDKHGFSFHTPCQDYIDLQIKKNKRTAAQIHRLNDSDDNISLVLAGYRKDFPEAKLPTYMFEGEVEQLSGYTSRFQGEKNWLEGNLGHKQLKYKAGVYILRPGALVDDEVREQVGDLLELAKKNASGEEEPEEEKVSKYGRGGIATIQMDRLSEVDLLGRERLVGAFMGMFVHTEEVEGFTVALLGDWGEGKSTVMKLLRKSLNEKHHGRFDFATFNAWEYEHTDNIAAGLSQEVVKGLKNNLGLGIFHKISLSICFNIIENRWNLFKLVLFGIISWVLYIYLDPLSFSFKGERLLNESVGTGLLGLSGLSTLIYLLKTAKNIIEHPLPSNLEKYFKLPNYAKHLGLIPVLKRHITTLCKLKLNTIRIPFTKIKIGKDRKLLVFVDDLDRCQTDCIARSLDAIRLVMSIPNVIVMIGIDDRIAFKAMENYYEKLGDKGRDKSKIARDYLGKIIQLPIRLMPSSSEEVRKYIEKRLFPDAQRIEDIKKDADIDTERDVIEPSKPTKEIIEAKREAIGDHIPDVEKAKEPKSVEEVLKDTTVEKNMFSDLARRFNFSNPRQLLRLRNSYRFLKVMDSDEKYDREILMKILFWHEFLNNWSPKIRYQCEKSVKEQESLAKIEKPEAKQIVQGVREDILKIIGMDMYEEIERFVRIVVLPHSEEGVLDTREEIEE